MNNYYTKLSFEKLEQFDINKSSLSSFVLIRNSLIKVLTKPEYYETPIIETKINSRNKTEQQVWLDSCFSELQDNPLIFNEEEYDENQEEFDSDEEEVFIPPNHSIMSFSKKKPTFFINEEEEEDNLISFDTIPFLSIENSNQSNNLIY